MTPSDLVCVCGHILSEHNEHGCAHNVHPDYKMGDGPVVTYPPEMLPKNDDDYEAEVIVIQFCECSSFTPKNPHQTGESR